MDVLLVSSELLVRLALRNVEIMLALVELFEAPLLLDVILLDLAETPCKLFELLSPMLVYSIQ